MGMPAGRLISSAFPGKSPTEMKQKV